MGSPVSLTGYLGTQAPGDLMVPDTTQKHPLGTIVDFLDPYYGLQRMIYAKSAAAHEVGSLVYFANGYVATDIPNTANTGLPIAVAKAAMTAADIYGWYITSGQAPWSATNSVAAGTALGVAGAGTCGTLANGKQILSARVAVASTGTFTFQGTTVNGSKVVKCSTTDGMFVGLVLSATGIAGGQTVASIQTGANTITLSAAATASGTVTVTATFTGWNIVYANAAFVQGQIV